ncbi:hypothetical protein AMECASPLE_033452 [Ameca splendens]|uniref:Helicase C-terminal domain-containing protein n=1 Tax=Ameca splendens TaxID=208324 RepID=A0ABV1ADX3_9TELE
MAKLRCNPDMLDFSLRAQHLADILSSKGLPAVCISGGLSQDQRLEAMSKLKQYQCRVLISTDLTSRGIDAEKVNLVINLDVPQDWETYMHRIGRAGRFGRSPSIKGYQKCVLFDRQLFLFHPFNRPRWLIMLEQKWLFASFLQHQLCASHFSGWHAFWIQLR